MTNPLEQSIAKASESIKDQIESAYFLGRMAQQHFDKIVMREAAEENVNLYNAVSYPAMYLSDDSLKAVLAEFDKSGLPR